MFSCPVKCICNSLNQIVILSLIEVTFLFTDARASTVCIVRVLISVSFEIEALYRVLEKFPQPPVLAFKFTICLCILTITLRDTADGLKDDHQVFLLHVPDRMISEDDILSFVVNKCFDSTPQCK